MAVHAKSKNSLHLWGYHSIKAHNHCISAAIPSFVPEGEFVASSGPGSRGECDSETFVGFRTDAKTSQSVTTLNPKPQTLNPVSPISPKP